MAGVSTRTLRYYDQAGLLRPSSVTEAGYRLYGNEAPGELAQILFFRELDFSIDEILRVRSSPDYDPNGALERQVALLTMRRDRLNRLIGLAGRALKGEVIMELNAFDMSEIEEAKAKYGEEARTRWGDTDAYRQSEAKTATYGKTDWARVKAETNAVFEGFAKLNRDGAAPDSPEAKALARQWQGFITRNFYDCTDEIMLGLASMYEADERFAKNIDKAGEGAAKFMTAAIRAACGRGTENPCCNS
jgi:DNA-binding transcriptional MerR regulator